MEDLVTLARAQAIGIYVFEGTESYAAASLAIALQAAGFDVDVTPDLIAETGERVFLLHFRPAALSLN